MKTIECRICLTVSPLVVCKTKSSFYPPQIYISATCPKCGHYNPLYVVDTQADALTYVSGQ